ncbi:hypothetical protein NDU88_010639 [Pleurodeles waltl]|uniref:Uncharacterized protein n=1 Tax=Pleurodeles waltl TaxID=8319 RepID=A0AAV7S1U2_PLEWA|nr:hypothetical protein NDU88_010639 [Pleurodeles waltl]
MQMAGGSSRVGAGDGGSSKAEARDEAPGEWRPGPTSVPIRLKRAVCPRDQECGRVPSAASMRRQSDYGTVEASGTWTSVDPRSSRAGVLDISRTLDPRPSRQGPGRSSGEGGGHQRERRDRDLH